MAAPTLQQAEDALKAAQATFDAAMASLNRALTDARSSAPRPTGYVPLSVPDARAAYDTALAARDAARITMRDAEAAAPREPHWSEGFAKVKGRIG